MSESDSFYLLREYLVQLQYQVVEELPSTLSGLWNTILFPFVAGLASLALCSLLILRLKRILVPATPPEIHLEALYSLQKQKPTTSNNKAVTVLQTLLRDTPDYVPARLSLAAVLLYRLHEAEQALEILHPIQNNNKAQSLMMDAKALAGGCSPSMLQAPLREEEYLSPAFAQAEAANVARQQHAKKKQKQL